MPDDPFKIHYYFIEMDNVVFVCDFFDVASGVSYYLKREIDLGDVSYTDHIERNGMTYYRYGIDSDIGPLEKYYKIILK